MPPTLLRPLGFGEILDGAFTLYRRHFATFFVTALIALVPMSLLLITLMGDLGDPELGLAVLLLVPIVAVAWLVLWSALTRQAARAIEGQPPSIADGYRHGVRAFLPLLAALLLAGVLFLVIGIPLVMVTSLVMIGLAGIVGEIGGMVVAMLYVIGIYGLLIAGFAMLFAVPAILVVERPGPWGAIKRSWRLSEGARLRVVGITLISSLIVALPTFGLYAVGFGTGMLTLESVGQPSPTWSLIEGSLSFLIGALTYPFWAAALTLLYFDRRVRTEAYDLELATEELASAG